MGDRLTHSERQAARSPTGGTRGGIRKINERLTRCCESVIGGKDSLTVLIQGHVGHGGLRVSEKVNKRHFTALDKEESEECVCACACV